MPAARSRSSFLVLLLGIIPLSGCVASTVTSEWFRRPRVSEATYEKVLAVVRAAKEEQLTPNETCERLNALKSSLDLRSGFAFSLALVNDERFLEDVRQTYCKAAEKLAQHQGAPLSLGEGETDLVLLAKNAMNMNQRRSSADEWARRYLEALSRADEGSVRKVLAVHPCDRLKDAPELCLQFELKAFRYRIPFGVPIPKESMAESSFETANAVQITNARLTALIQLRKEKERLEEEERVRRREEERQAEAERKQREAEATPEYWGTEIRGNALGFHYLVTEYNNWTRHGHVQEAKAELGPKIAALEVKFCILMAELQKRLPVNEDVAEWLRGHFSWLTRIPSQSRLYFELSSPYLPGSKICEKLGHGSRSYMPDAKAGSNSRFTWDRKRSYVVDQTTMFEWYQGTGAGWLNGELADRNGLDAKSDCNALGRGWRLPTRAELESLVDRALKDPASSLPNISPKWHWTETRNSGEGGWLVDFGKGSSFVENIFFRASVRCVR